LAPVLDKINIEIPYGQTTAIVGDSGSGKSTLLKLLLRFYPTTSGNITLGYTGFTSIDLHEWRDRCGAVLQDGKLLNSTILENITLQAEEVDHQRLNYAIEASNLTEFINDLPLKLYTHVGQGGTGMSGGQKQRILIARAIYKDPDYIFLDEATNALDANNERAISENLIKFTEGKTSVIIAHRLSTVMAADQIVVLEKGKVVELGSHGELLHQEGHYFNLVKNQMLVA
jgi:ATP-binding cassette subfamily B protein